MTRRWAGKVLYVSLGAFVALLIYGAYQEATKSGPNTTRLACQEHHSTFERLHGPHLVRAFQKAYERGSARMDITLEPSKHMPPTLFSTLSHGEIMEMATAGLALTPSQHSLLHVKLLVYENDKADPNKKNEAAKRYLGYIKASFYMEEELVYQIQMDFMESSQIKKRLACMRHSVLTLE